LVTKKDEERRQEIHRAYEEKLKKWDKKKEALNKLHKPKKEDLEEEEYRREKIQKQKEAQAETQKTTYQRMIERINKSEAQKKVELDKKVGRLMQLNNSFQERYVSCMKKKEVEMSYYVEDTLSSLENKFTVTELRKKRFNEERRGEALKHLEGVEGRLSKVQEESKVKAKVQLEKLIGKMEKVRSRSLLLSRKKTEREQKPIEEDSEFMARMGEKTTRDHIAEKQRLESLKEKQKKSMQFVQDRKNNWSDFIAERKEMWNQKMENIHENKEIAHEASGKYISHQMKNYKYKLDQMQKMKDERVRQLAKINKTFTTSAH